MAAHFKRLQLRGERSVAKVVPERIFSMAVHPSTEHTLVFAGDKRGFVGLYNLDEPDDDRCVVSWRPHTRPVSCLAIDPSNAHQVCFLPAIVPFVQKLTLQFHFIPSGLFAGPWLARLHVTRC